ncbi:FISUMP domain-containing protein [Culturomica massiliensis]|uniref:FISUMP domain-containing protein n=3 Tax=Culturomica TaxID=1926651 RepID=UPI003AEF5A22
MMNRLVKILFFMFAVVGTVSGNNVRIEGDVRVLDTDIDLSTNIATVSLQLKWDNSWRDDFNYDAVYLFLKYKVDGQREVWHHAYLEGVGHEIDNGYSYLMSNSQKEVSGKANHNEGIFIYRSVKGYGAAVVNLKLKWNIKSNPDKELEREMFTAGNVFLSAMGIEMVYVPRGGFRAGDTKSSRTFQNGDVTFPSDQNLLVPSNIDECSSALPSTDNPPAFAVNLMNDVSRDASNAWVGRAGAAAEGVDFVDYWQVKLKKPATIRSFAIESIEGGTPEQWQLQVFVSSQWKAVYPKYGDPTAFADGSEWAVNSRQTYPCTRTLRIDPGFSESSSNYRIRIYKTTNAPVIKNIAMSTSDILSDVDNSVLVYDSITTLDTRFGLYSRDGDTWSGQTSVDYPNGYKAFFVMKYEISQEQYVAFLNKLTAAQQRTRTIGASLGSLEEGMYVFGGVGTRAVGRNGIKLASIGADDAPYVFANDLEPGNDYSQDGDGQTIACNFLNAGDMMAYADWCGLRPLTELEFEKMARRPYPEVSLRGEYAWNTNGNFTPATGFQGVTAGTKGEKVNGGNVNAGDQLKGPVRCGVFALPSGSQVDAGASFWGVMELSGNLSELYYNVNSEGRLFRGILDKHHGSGKLDGSGKSNVDNNYWPEVPDAFALRGGSYRDVKERTCISDRERNARVYSTTTEVNSLRDSTVTFRLGRTAPVEHGIAEVTLENGQSSFSSVQDSVCSGSDYTIGGTVPSGIDGAYHIAWFMSSDGGANWDLLEGEESPSLKLYNLRNVNSKEDVFKDYWYKRYIYTNKSDFVQSHPVCLRVINRTLHLSTTRDTVDVYDRSKGIRIESPQAATFAWSWLRDNVVTPIDVEYVLKEGKIEKHYFRYTDFYDGSQFEGEQKIRLEIEVMNKCRQSDTIYVYVVKKPDERNNYDNQTGRHNSEFKCGEILIDNEEGIASKKRYRTVEIGGKCWFADNLNRTLASGQSGAVKCYGDVESNCDTYGRLYNWLAATQNDAGAGVQGICPTGWHLPTNDEWIDLFATLGTTVDASNSVVDGKAIKGELNYWGGKTNPAANIGDNTIGFNAQPGGGLFYAYSGSYMTEAGIASRNGYNDIGERGWWWTSTTTGTLWSYWYSNSTGWSMQYMPYYVRMDEDGKVAFNINKIVNPSYASLTNTIFHSTVHHYILDNTSSNNGNALTRVRTNFYFSVRCVKD